MKGQNGNICSMVQILYMCSYMVLSPFPRGRHCAPRLSFGDVLHMLACGHWYNHILHQWVLLSSWEINFSDCQCKYLESRVSSGTEHCSSVRLCRPIAALLSKPSLKLMARYFYNLGFLKQILVEFATYISNK